MAAKKPTKKPVPKGLDAEDRREFKATGRRPSAAEERREASPPKGKKK